MMRSRSTFGLSLITLVFRDGIEDYWSRQRIIERIQNATLPPGLTPGLDPLSSPTGQILYYTLESDTKGLRELSEIERWIVIPSAQAGAGRRRRLQLRRHHDAVPARARSAAAHALQPVAQERHRRDQRQQRQRRRQRGQSRRARLRDPRHRPRADARRSGQHRRGRSATARRSWCAISASSSSTNQERHGILGKDDRNDVVEGTVLLLRGDNPSRVLERRPRQGRRAQRALESRGRADRALYRPPDLVDATIDKVGAHDLRRASASCSSSSSCFSAARAAR